MDFIDFDGFTYIIYFIDYLHFNNKNFEINRICRKHFFFLNTENYINIYSIYLIILNLYMGFIHFMDFTDIYEYEYIQIVFIL